jgi:hypothetical protein
MSQDNTLINEDDEQQLSTERTVLFSNTSRHRLVKNWLCPKPPRNIDITSSGSEVEVEDLNLEFDWASETALHVGSVVHRILEQISTENITDNEQVISQVTHSGKIMLTRLGVIDEQLDSALQRVITSIRNTVEDSRGQWILSNKHLDAKSEYKITAALDGEVKHLIIDRTFIDEHDVRWVIDYKTGNHEGGGLEEYLDREQQRYEPQLQRYAEVMKLLDGREVKMALYFPMMQQWREW